MINISGNTVDSPILKIDTLTSDSSTIVLEKELSSSTEIKLTAPSINLDGNVDLIGNINHNGSDIFTEIQNQIDNTITTTNLKKILTQNITMQVGAGKQFTHLEYALEEASNYSVGYEHFNTYNQYRITIPIDNGYNSDIWGAMKGLYLPHVDIVCLGIISAPNVGITFEGCTFGSINLSFMGGNAAFLTFEDCKISSLTLSSTAPGDKLYLHNTNIHTLHIPNLETRMYSSTVYTCTGKFPEVIHMSNIKIENSSSTINSFTIESSIVRIEDSSVSTTKANPIPVNIIRDSNISFYNSTIVSASSSALNLYSSNVDFVGGAITGNSTMIRAHKNSNISISGECSLTSLYGYSNTISSYTGSKVTIEANSSLFNQAEMTGLSEYGLYCDNAEIILKSSDSLAILNSYMNEAISVRNGGKISLVNVTGTKNIAVNTLTANGIIFSN